MILSMFRTAKSPEGHELLPTRASKDDTKSKPADGRSRPISALGTMLRGVVTTASAPLGPPSPSIEEAFTPPRDESVHDRAMNTMMPKGSQAKEAEITNPTSSPSTDDVNVKEEQAGKVNEPIDKKGKEKEKTFSTRTAGSAEEASPVPLLPEDVFPPSPEDIFDPASGNLVGLMRNILPLSDEVASAATC